MLEDLLQLARQGLSLSPEDDGERFVEAVEGYLGKFEQWRLSWDEQAMESLPTKEKDALRAQLAVLKELHQQLMSKIDLGKQGLLDQMSDFGKRAKALRSYIDHYPSRITIAGRRKG